MGVAPRFKVKVVVFIVNWSIASLNRAVIALVTAMPAELSAGTVEATAGAVVSGASTSEQPAAATRASIVVSDAASQNKLVFFIENLRCGGSDSASRRGRAEPPPEVSLGAAS
jgi:hypothetical protein